ncbi:MAG TPA: metallophosphoesterase [Actinomycetota bacterium]|nr:metallophosphoesterase [Actinomycetota bacterium]
MTPSWSSPENDGVVRVGVVADLHHDVAGGRPPRRWHNDYEPELVEERLERGLDLLHGAGARGLLVLGDVSERGDDASTARVLEACRDAFEHVGVVPGNHDGPQLAPIARARGARALADDDFALGHVVVGGVGVAPAGGTTSRFASSHVRIADGSSLVASHFPLVPLADEFAAAGLSYPGDLVDRAAVRAVVRRHAAPVVVVSGHVHGRTARADGELLQLTVAALVEAPYEVSVVEVSTTQALTVTRRALRLGPPKPFEPVFTRSDETWTWTGARWHRLDAPDTARA